MSDQSPPPVILASQSGARAAVLTAAAVPFTVQPARIDEDTIKQSLHAEDAPAIEAATVLAEMKAVKVSSAAPNALVIGSDQILDLDGSWFDKPADAAGVADHLRALSGKRHTLATATVAALGGRRIWHSQATPVLTMRPVSDAFIADYVAACGDTAVHSVGGYQLEGRGVQLFSDIQGDYFTILGLNLLPLLGFLREHRVLAV